MLRQFTELFSSENAESQRQSGINETTTNKLYSSGATRSITFEPTAVPCAKIEYNNSLVDALSSIPSNEIVVVDQNAPFNGYLNSITLNSSKNNSFADIEMNETKPPESNKASVCDSVQAIRDLDGYTMLDVDVSSVKQEPYTNLDFEFFEFNETEGRTIKSECYDTSFSEPDVKNGSLNTSTNGVLERTTEARNTKKRKSSSTNDSMVAKKFNLIELTDIFIERTINFFLKKQRNKTYYERQKKKNNSKRIRLMQYHRKTLIQKDTSMDLESKKVKKMFTQQQINYLNDIVVENKERDRLFMTEYLKSVYPSEPPAALFKEFSESNVVNLRSFTMKKMKSKNTINFLTDENYHAGKLNTDYRAYYRSNDASLIEIDIDKRNQFFKRLYVSYENGTAFYNIRSNEKLSLNVYEWITEGGAGDKISREQNLEYANTLFDMICKYPISLDCGLCIIKTFAYNLLVYASTRLDAKTITDETYKEYFKEELERIYTEFMLPEETDYFYAFIFLAYLENEKKKKKIFTKRLKSPEYVRAIAFYHFKYLYYIFYNLHRLGPYTKGVFYRSMTDFPDSLAFLTNTIERFITNTFYIIYYKKGIDLDINDANDRFTFLVYLLKNGLKYLNKDVTLEEHLENLLNDIVSLLNLNPIIKIV